MKTLTLYRAYKYAENEKQTAATIRASRWGIAVETDKYALIWQRYDRLSRNLDYAIQKRLGVVHDYGVCFICGWRDDICKCRKGE